MQCIDKGSLTLPYFCNQVLRSPSLVVPIRGKAMAVNSHAAMYKASALKFHMKFHLKWSEDCVISTLRLPVIFPPAVTVTRCVSLTQRLKMASVRSSFLIAACPWRVGALFWDMIAIFCLNCDLPYRPQTRWRTIHSRHEVFLRTPNALTCSPGSICKGSRTLLR